MKWDAIHINGAAAHLGRTEEIATVVAEGRYDETEARDDAYLSIRVADQDVAPVDMAVTAGRAALDRAGLPSDVFALVLHASIAHQGLDHFTAASYIQGRTVGGRAQSLEIKQSSNGGMAALELAAAYLSAASGEAAALITTSDKFAAPAYDRYRSDGGMVMSDGATGLALSRRPGVARLLSTSIIGDATHENAYRGEVPWTAAPGDEGWPLDIRARRGRHLENGGNIWEIVKDLTARQQESIDLALTDADTGIDEISRVVFPNVGRSVQDWGHRKAHGVDETQATWEWGRRVGHIGAGDQLAGLTHLLETGAVSPGDKVMLCGIGSGWSFSAAVLEVTDLPDWPVTTL
ncbi:ketoacyl-ACP synthase III family protein [Streptomyces sp. NPDC102360]|uniref:ketoacyl-ACP synthase III family protein n=1 Tax=Streptomyces sp. NPDC102360 TaxID=3366160 RepID=UPI0037FA041C